MRKLQGMDEAERAKCAKKYTPSDLPPGVCDHVAAFVGRARFVTQRLAQRRPALCVPCDRAGCDKRLLVDRSGPQHIGGAAGMDDTSSDSDDEDEGGGGDYWTALTTRPLTILPRKTFCSRACACAYEVEVDEAVPIRLTSLEASYACSDGKVGLSRVAAEAHACFLRNAAAARALRAAMRGVRNRHISTIRPDVVARMHADIVHVLNIDLALVSSASVLAESRAASIGRTLPAMTAGWRADPKSWKPAIRAIQKIYARHYHDDGLATDERLPPHWLQSVCTVARSLFPTAASVVG
jgi:hypothetical protein